MKIQKMTAWFGRLGGDELTLSDGLNVLYAPNEGGKSTWCAFLRVMLFGLSTSQAARSGQPPDRVRYRPWSGAPMGGRIELLSGALGPVTLQRRTARDNRPMQEFSARVTGTDLPVRGLDGATAGQTLTGVTAEVFRRTAFIGQAGLAVTEDPELERRIGTIVSSGEEEVSFQEARARLNAWLRHRRRGSAGAIPETEEEIRLTRERLDSLRALETEAAAADAEGEKLRRMQEETRERMLQARAAQRKASLASLAAAREAVQTAGEHCRAAGEEQNRVMAALERTPFGTRGPKWAESRLRGDTARLEELAAQAAQRGSAAWVLAPICLALLLVLSLLLPGGALPAVTAAALAAMSLALGWDVLRRSRARARAAEERERLLRGYGAQSPGELPALASSYRALWAEKERAEEEVTRAAAELDRCRHAQREAEAAAMRALDFTDGDSPAALAGRELEALKARENALRERRSLAGGRAAALGDPAVLESALEALETRRDELLGQERALRLALETLTEADDEMQLRLSPLLAEATASYFSRLTDGRYDEVTLARDLTARARPAGGEPDQPASFLSAGTRDQLYLALRLALCDLVLPAEDPCPLILDDALVTFDGDRLASALRLLRELAANRQILLFTCHTREAAFFAGDGEVRCAAL